MRLPIVLLLVVLPLFACSGGSAQWASADWNGLSSYAGSVGGSGDPTRARAEAFRYQTHAAPEYRAPGPTDDAWAPIVQDAARRFGLPETWIREVMRRESGGRLHDAQGRLVTSWAGAMGLMQIMPSTYAVLRERYGLGTDPYDPQNNVMAGAAYIREMYDRYGAPNFLAAYNAGPLRLEAFLAGTAVLPNETMNYIAAIAPRLGLQSPVAGAPGAVIAARAMQRFAMMGVSVCNIPIILAPGLRNSVPVIRIAGFSVAPVQAPIMAGDRPMPGQIDRSETTQIAPDRPGPLPGSVSRAPHFQLASFAVGHHAPPATPGLDATPIPLDVAVMRQDGSVGAWRVEIGEFSNQDASRNAAAAARGALQAQLADSQIVALPEHRDGALFFRTQIVGLSSDDAASACNALMRHHLDCTAVPPGV